MTTHSNDTHTNSLKKSVSSYIDRLLLPIRMEAEGATIGLGFEVGNNLAEKSPTNSSIGKREASTR
jgi:hypothetical protein